MLNVEYCANFTDLTYLRLLCNLAGYWIGLSDQETEGQFMWTNGEVVNYTYWYPGSPSNRTGEDCTRFWSSWLWNNAHCTAEIKSICESKTFVFHLKHCKLHVTD